MTATKGAEGIQLPVRDGEDPWTAEEVAELREELVGEVERMTRAIEVAQAELADLLADGSDGANGSSNDEPNDKETGDLGFPAGTPIKEMDATQQAAYWRHQARKHETENKKFRGVNLEELQTKAKAHDEIERELMSDKDKAVEDAKAEARREATEQTVIARMDAAAARVGMTAEKFAEISEWVDPRRFVNNKGDVDLDAINRWAEANKPSETEQKQQQRGPSPAGAGAAGARTGPSVAAGRAEYEAKKAAKAQKRTASNRQAEATTTPEAAAEELA